MVNQRKTIPLTEAWFFFANSDRKTKFIELRKSEAVFDYQATGFWDGLSKLAKISQERRSKRDAQNALKNDMQKSIINLLSKNELESYGYFNDENGCQKRRKIQPEAWSPSQVDWNCGTATFGSMVLFGVRVFIPEAPKDRGNKAKTGRPSREREIYDALLACDIDPGFANLVPKQRFEIVRDRIIEKYPYLDGRNKGVGRSKILECDKIYFENKKK